MKQIVKIILLEMALMASYPAMAQTTTANDSSPNAANPQTAYLHNNYPHSGTKDSSFDEPQGQWEYQSGME